MNVLLELFVSFVLLIVQPRVLQVVFKILNTEMDRKVRTTLLTNGFLDKRINKREKPANDESSLTFISFIFQKSSLQDLLQPSLCSALYILWRCVHSFYCHVFSCPAPTGCRHLLAASDITNQELDKIIVVFVCFAAEVKINAILISEFVPFILLQLDMGIFNSIYYESIKAFCVMKDISNVLQEGRSFSFYFNLVYSNKVSLWQIHLCSIWLLFGTCLFSSRVLLNIVKLGRFGLSQIYCRTLFNKNIFFPSLTSFSFLFTAGYKLGSIRPCLHWRIGNMDVKTEIIVYWGWKIMKILTGLQVWLATKVGAKHMYHELTLVITDMLWRGYIQYTASPTLAISRVYLLFRMGKHYLKALYSKTKFCGELPNILI